MNLRRAPLPASERRLYEEHICIICMRAPATLICYCADCWAHIRARDLRDLLPRGERRDEREEGTHGS